MSYLRNSSLRRLIVTLFLLSAATVQAQTLFACPLMDGAPQTTCCCGEPLENGCPMDGGAADGIAMDCCDVTVDVALQDLAVASTTAKLIGQQNAPQPPPAVPLAAEFHFAPANAPLLPVPRRYHPSLFLGTPTYLLTHRFRI